jgi:hypothetical protein
LVVGGGIKYVGRHSGIPRLVGSDGKAHLVEWERLGLHLLLHLFEILVLILSVIVGIRLGIGGVKYLLGELWRVAEVIGRRRGWNFL